MARVDHIEGGELRHPDTPLVLRMLQGEEGAYRCLYRRLNPTMWRVALQYCRNRDTAAEVVQLSATLTDYRSDRDPERRAVDREFVDILKRCVEELPERTRTAFIARRLDGMSALEAAEALESTDAGIRVALYRAQRVLRARLEDFVP